ncbi:signal peptidase I [Labilibaculum sp. DW002]|uniref:Signal peptidase I n=1 Tax=Paralabilibaculum antarcticum TaxID=2912572 RepID=A0ABT5VR86_9BACT|nr:signal peptidase I [Labilibaculum sp. DW002]MDE5417939.1 signal peptidase I [Labilibaculum sp. DW002]
MESRKIIKTIWNILERGVYIVFIIGFIIFLLKTFFISAYKIPSHSMSPNLIVGDWICVDKIGFGSSKQMFGKIYSLPKFRDIKRGDVVVFHFPEGDTVFCNRPMQNYYEMLERKRKNKIDNIGFVNYGEKCFLPIRNRPVYVKRCIGLPGEIIQIVHGIVKINGDSITENYNFKRLWRVYYHDKWACEKDIGSSNYWRNRDERITDFSLTDKERKVFQARGDIDSIKVRIRQRASIYYFPKELDEKMNWDAINYGPVKIPKKGSALILNGANIAFYRRLIETYEGNRIEMKEDGIYINEIHTDSYVPKQDYYFMMGDNRDLSIDSRIWGFVPEDHLIGKVFMIGWSSDVEEKTWSGIRWNRIGESINN